MAKREEHWGWIMGGLVFSVAGVGLLIVLTRWLWGWFVMPLGVPDIGYAHAFGLGLLGRVLVVWQHDDEKKQKETSSQRLFGRALGQCLGLCILLGLGWVLRWWVM